MAIMLGYLALALGVSFVCSILEAALLSITPSYITMLERDGDPAGARLQALKQDIDKPLAAILSLNTIAHTVGAAGVGARAQEIFGSEYMAVISGVLTLLILVLSEIIPKTLGARYWRGLARFIAPTLRWMTLALYPLVWLSLRITGLLGAGAKPLSLSREEFSAMAHQGHEEGIFDEDEARMLHNLMRFGSLSVTDVLTPRVVVEMLSEDVKVSELQDRLSSIRFSRLPLYSGSPDDVTGFVLKTDLYGLVANRQTETRLGEVRRDMLALPDSQSVRAAFRKLLARQEHIAMIVDEYGSFVGIVTLEDLIETLLGLEIVDEADTVDDMRKLARRRWRQRAEALGIVKPDDPEF